jgi:hypothetical protein
MKLISAINCLFLLQLNFYQNKHLRNDIIFS